MSLRYPAFTDMLFNIITKQVQAVMNVSGLNDIRKIDTQLARQAEYEKQIAALNDNKRRLYERLILGELDIEGYKADKEPLDAEIYRLTQISAVLSSELAKLAQDSRHRQLARQVRTESRLTLPLANLLIEKVLIFPGERVEVRWKVAEFFDMGDGGEWNVG